MSFRGAAIFLVMLAGGCSATIIPPPQPDPATTVYIADYGRPSSLLLPNPASGGWTEYAWGDWDWFALGDAHWYMIPRTAFFSDQATLCLLNIPHAQNPQALQRTLGADQI